ncbi:hypothetical protein [Mycoplasma sp. SG1]|uniref:hypothetical protein n=1 Tax=Mycoplasma sp. SG1 TaxID=2810348 RepID=UPI002024EABC|nr:hypothetical protein [Mycoplasma sp. SG1]URM52756.1 hypothetical protein JRW51_00140 [Mycoplasma sp. SG1]
MLKHTLLALTAISSLSSAGFVNKKDSDNNDSKVVEYLSDYKWDHVYDLKDFPTTGIKDHSQVYSYNGWNKYASNWDKFTKKYQYFNFGDKSIISIKSGSKPNEGDSQSNNLNKFYKVSDIPAYKPIHGLKPFFSLDLENQKMGGYNKVYFYMWHDAKDIFYQWYYKEDGITTPPGYDAYRYQSLNITLQQFNLYQANLENSYNIGYNFKYDGYYSKFSDKSDDHILFENWDKYGTWDQVVKKFKVLSFDSSFSEIRVNNSETSDVAKYDKKPIPLERIPSSKMLWTTVVISKSEWNYFDFDLYIWRDNHNIYFQWMTKCATNWGNSYDLFVWLQIASLGSVNI